MGNLAITGLSDKTTRLNENGAALSDTAARLSENGTALSHTTAGLSIRETLLWVVVDESLQQLVHRKVIHEIARFLTAWVY
jgi:hypothetical protein